MDFNSMFGGMNINDLMNNPKVKEITDSIKSNGANENAVLAMITNMLEDKNNAEMVERLVTGLKPSLNDEEKKIVDGGNAVEGLKKLLSYFMSRPDRVKELTSVLMSQFGNK